MQKHSIEISDVIQKGMLPVVRKRDILVIRVLSRKEKIKLERGGPDVMCKTPSGQKIMLHRKDIIENYTYLNGNKISMAGLSSSKEYMVMKDDNTQAFAMMVPLNCTVKIGKDAANSHNRKRGDYIVAEVGENGQPDIRRAGIVPSALFKKIYHIPPHDIIMRHRGSNNTLFKSGKGKKNNLSAALKVRSGLGKKTIDFAGELGMNSSGLDFGDGDMYKQRQQPVARHEMRMNTRQPTQESTNYKYIASARLMDNMGKLVGFAIQDKDGNSRNVTTAEMLELCNQKLVSNIKSVIRHETGKKYLSGNNIRIDTLPVYRV